MVVHLRLSLFHSLVYDHSSDLIVSIGPDLARLNGMEPIEGGCSSFATIATPISMMDDFVDELDKRCRDASRRHARMPARSRLCHMNSSTASVTRTLCSIRRHTF